MKTYLIILIVLSVAGIYFTADSYDKTDKITLLVTYSLVFISCLIKLVR